MDLQVTFLFSTVPSKGTDR